MSKRFLSGINVTGSAALNTVADAGSNTDKFLVLDSSNVVSYRTAAELYADLGIGSLPAGYTSTLKHEVKAGQAISKGQAVYVSSADGTNMIVTKASNVSEGTSSKTMGLLETSLSTNGKGNVITEGLLAGLNTNGATAGDPVWLGVDGALIFGLANKPYAPAHLVFIGIVTRANANNGEIFVKVQNGFEMRELHNYQEGSVQNNDVIVYESSTSLYKPKTIATILGYTPANDASVVKLSGAQTVGGLKTFSASIIANIGVLLKNGAISGLNGYTAIGGSSSNGIEIVFSPGGSTQSLLFQTSAAYSYTFPAATGTVALTSDLTSYVPNTRTLTINGTTYDLSANRSWTISANQNARTEYEFTTNGSTATYTATYSVGQVDVFYNGSKLSSAEFTATNGTSVTLAFTPPTGQMVEIVAWETGGGVANGRTLTINGTAYDLSADRSWTVTDSSKLPLSGGTLTGALNGTSALFTDNLRTDTGLGLKYGSFVSTSGYLNLFSALVGSTYTLNLKNGTSGYETSLSFNNTANRNYIFPNADGTIALTSNLSAYLPLTGGTLTGVLNGIGASFTNAFTDNINILQTSGSTTKGHLGQFADSLYISNNYFYNGVQSYDDTSKANSSIEMGTGFIYFKTGAANTTPSTKITITSGGDIGIGNGGFASTRLTVTGKDNTSSNYSFVANNASNANLFLVRNDGAAIFSGSVTTAGFLNYNSGDGNDWYINPPSNGPTIRLKYHGGSTNRSGGLGWINNAGGRTEALTWQDTTVTFGGTSISPRDLGKNYSQTSGGGTGTAIVDTGITYNSGDFDGYGRGASYQVVVGANPNAGGSGAYYGMYFGIIQVYTGWSGSAVTTYINYTSLAAANGGGNLTVSAAFWNGSTETTGIGVYTTGYQIRVKVAGYNSSYTGQDQAVYLKRIS
jgi:predicted heme/steroid binding protein